MKLLLKNFRSHKKFELEIGAITVLVGPNGVGKTNVLEAISFISAARSFRVEDKRNLIKSDADFCQIKLGDLETIVSKVPRLVATFKINGAKKRLYDFVGELPSVVFTPESLAIVAGAPVERRRFLDTLLSQVSKKYLKALLEYRQVIQRRNRLLGMIADGQAEARELDFWDEKLCAAAAIIVQERQDLEKFLSSHLPDLYKKISAKSEKLKIIYKCQMESPSIEKLQQKRVIEIAARTTIYGPHRDDLIFLIDNKEASNFASRGELRSIVLALKLAELKFLAKMKNSGNESKVLPLLLLDDIFSELDKYHRQQIYELIKSYQTVLTTTDLEHLSPELLREAKVVELK